MSAKSIQFTFLLIVPAVAIAQSSTFDPKDRSVSNWQEQARLHLDGAHDFNRKNSHNTYRCIKLNNYWCLKDVGWNGGIGRDADNHTAFLNASYGARAVVRNLRTAYFKRNLKSAYQIMSIYAPVNDCIGSKAGMRPDGTCIFGKNPTEMYARVAAKGITDDTNVDLQLFDKNGNATSALTIFLQHVSTMETGGFKATTEVIEKGVCLESRICRDPTFSPARLPHIHSDGSKASTPAVKINNK